MTSKGFQKSNRTRKCCIIYSENIKFVVVLEISHYKIIETILIHNYRANVPCGIFNVILKTKGGTIMIADTLHRTIIKSIQSFIMEGNS